MIKIRYSNPGGLPPGLHAVAERHGRATTVYLLSGLTRPQRHAVLRRLQVSARMGYGPRLPAARLALALLADRIRTALSRAAAVFRLHPAGSMLPLTLIGAVLLLSTVSVRVLPAPGGSVSPDLVSASAAGACVPLAPLGLCVDL